MDKGIKEVKVVRYRDKVNVYNHATQKTTEMNVLDAIRHVLVDTKVEYMLGNRDVNVMVKLSTDGTLRGVILEPKSVPVSPSSSSSTVYCNCSAKKGPSSSDQRSSNKFESELEPKPSTSVTVFDNETEEEGFNSPEDTDGWWRNKSEDEEEEEEDLDLTLHWDDDNDMFQMEETIFPDDVFQATQLPPERISGILQKRKEATSKKEANVGCIITETKEEEEQNEPNNDSWKDCWNCKAPSPPPGIYRDDPDNLRLRFCCDKSREAFRVKPTNTAIEWGSKMYPYDSWVNHGI